MRKLILSAIAMAAWRYITKPRPRPARATAPARRTADTRRTATAKR